MKIAIAADLAPTKIGSGEYLLFAVGRGLTEAGCQVRYLFSGSLSESVRRHFALDGSSPVVTEIGTPVDRRTRQRWLRSTASPPV